jgi:LPXTG-motif cell wall-anchored protein
VPGDERTESFLVRNQSDQDGQLSIDILDTAVHNLLDTGGLSINAQGAGGVWTSISTPGTHRLLSDGSVPAHGIRQVDVTVIFDPDSTNVSQLKSLDLAFRIHLVQDVGGGGGGSDGSGGSDGPDESDGSNLLPDTGAPFGAWALVGLVALGIGAVMTRRGSRREVSR